MKSVTNLTTLEDIEIILAQGLRSRWVTRTTANRMTGYDYACAIALKFIRAQEAMEKLPRMLWQH